MFHLTSTGCALVLQKDMEYWGIDELLLEPCCALKYYPEIELCCKGKLFKIYILVNKARRRSPPGAAKGGSRTNVRKHWVLH